MFNYNPRNGWVFFIFPVGFTSFAAAQIQLFLPVAHFFGYSVIC